MPIEESRGALITKKEQLTELVEAPLLKACEELYDKNIRTLSASANRKDLAFENAGIWIDFDTLSEGNKDIGRSLGNIHFEDGSNELKIKIPVTEDTTSAEVEDYANQIAHKFKKQPMTWAPSYTIQQMQSIFAIDPNDESFSPKDFDEFYYDEVGKLFYLSAEHFRKANEVV